MYTHLFKIPSKFSTPSGEVILTGYILVDQKEKEKEKSRSKVCNDFVQFRKEKERKKFKNLQKKFIELRKKFKPREKFLIIICILKKQQQLKKLHLRIC